MYPNFLIVGAPKTATTSLYYYMKEHPQIYFSPLKEPHYLAIADMNEEEIKRKYPCCPYNLKKYLELFNKVKNEKAIGEATTRYIYYHKKTIEHIKKIIPNWENLKIIIVLRNPLQRAISQYYALYTNGMEERSIKEAILNAKKEDPEINRKKGIILRDYIGPSFYYESVSHYIKTFNNVKIIIYEDLKKDINSTLKDIFEFLEVNKEFVPKNINKRYRKGDREFKNILYKHLYITLKKIKPTKVLPQTIKRSDFYIKRIYRPIRDKIFTKEIPLTREEIKYYNEKIFGKDINKLEKLLNRDLKEMWLQ